MTRSLNITQDCIKKKYSKFPLLYKMAPKACNKKQTKKKQVVDKVSHTGTKPLKCLADLAFPQ